ncbi:MAG: outer membrane beta-barrel protein [Flavobacterium sp.]
MIKKTLFFLVVLFCIKSNAQHVRAYAGSAAYRHTDFNGNIFGEVGAGVEVKIHRFFKPEIGVSYFFGNLQESTNVDAVGNVLNKTNKEVSAINYNVTPKIALYSSEAGAGDVFLQILPRYNISKIQAERFYTIINQTNPANSVTKKETLTQWQQSFGIGVGLDIVLSDKNYDSLAINVYYNGINLGKPLTDISNNNTNYDTRTLGMGFSYYLGFEKKKL